MLKLSHILIHKHNIAFKGILIKGHELDGDQLFLSFTDLNRIFHRKKSTREFLFRFLLLHRHARIFAFSSSFFLQFLIQFLLRRKIIDNNFIIRIQVFKDIFHFDIHFFAFIQWRGTVPGTYALTLCDLGFELKDQGRSLYVAFLLVGETDSM